MKNNKSKNIYLMLTFIGIMFFSIFFFYYENDYYWHSKIGNYIINNKSIPFIDVFSWYGIANNLHWISHEWLFGVFINIFELIFGRFGPLIYVAIMLLMISYLLFKLSKEFLYKNSLYTIILSLFGLVIFCNKMVPRPHLLSYLFVILTLMIIKNIFNNEKNRSIYFVPLITILWANIHGGSSNLGYILYFLVFLSSISFLPKHISITKVQRNNLMFACISSFIFILVNPHFYKMIIYPYINMTYSNMINCIDEWQAINIMHVDGIIYLLLMVLIIFFLIKNFKKINLLDVFILLPFMILAIKSIKFMPYFYIMTIFTIPKYWNTSNIIINEKIVLYFITLGFILFSTFLFHLDYFKKIEDNIINYIKNDENIVLYNSYNLGGYLIYKDVKVFIDGRADLYVDSILCDVCDIEKNSNFTKLDNYSFNTYIVQNNTNIYDYLNNNSKYELIMSDKYNTLFKKNPDN